MTCDGARSSGGCSSPPPLLHEGGWGGAHYARTCALASDRRRAGDDTICAPHTRRRGVIGVGTAQTHTHTRRVRCANGRACARDASALLADSAALASRSASRAFASCSPPPHTGVTHTHTQACSRAAGGESATPHLNRLLHALVGGLHRLELCVARVLPPPCEKHRPTAQPERSRPLSIPGPPSTLGSLRSQPQCLAAPAPARPAAAAASVKLPRPPSCCAAVATTRRPPRAPAPRPAAAGCHRAHPRRASSPRAGCRASRCAP